MADYNGTSGNDTITGSASADTINAGAGNDIVYGGGGNDIIHGGAGNDTLNGGTGFDKLFGGAGADTLIYNVWENLWKAGSNTSVGAFAGYDAYDGGTGPAVKTAGGVAELDVLQIRVSWAQMQDAGFMTALQAEVAQYQTYLATRLHNGQTDSSNFTFKTINLVASAFESVVLTNADGVVIPRGGFSRPIDHRCL